MIERCPSPDVDDWSHKDFWKGNIGRLDAMIINNLSFVKYKIGSKAPGHQASTT